MSSQTSALNTDMDTAEDNSLTIIRTIVLLFLLVVSLVGNALVVFAIAVSSKRTQNPFNAYLLSMAAFGLLECSLTMSLATGFSLEGAWLFGDFLKGFNACFIQLQNIGILLTLAAMTVDRYMSVSDLLKYRKESSVHRANYAVLYTWIHAFLVSLPLLFHNSNLGLIVREYVERSLCGLAEETSIVYITILIATSYIAPFCLAVIYLVMVFAKSAKERKEMKTSNTANYATYCLQESQLLIQARCAKFVLILFVFYLAFKLPYVCIDLLTQFGVPGAYIPLNLTNSTSTPSESPDGKKFYYQSALSWIMFCFSAMYPILTLLWFGDHRKRIRIHLCCGKERVPLTKSQARSKGHHQYPRHMLDGTQRQHGKNRVYRRGSNTNNNNRLRVKKGPSSIASVANAKEKSRNTKGGGETGPLKGFRVPVLYAAADGLHLLASKTSKDPALLRTTSGGNKSVHPPSSSDGDSPRQSESKGDEGNSPTTPTSKTPRNWLTLNPGELLKRFKKTSMSNTSSEEGVSAGVSPQDTMADRPSSVVDKRVDVLGSTDCLQSEEESYFRYACSDLDDDTESELNESANSRTLILPSRGVIPPVKKVRRGRAAVVSPLPPMKGTNLGFLQDEEPPNDTKNAQSIEELFSRTTTPPSEAGGANRRLPNNILRKNIDDITSLKSFGSSQSVRFESDTMSLSNSVYSSGEKGKHDRTDDRIFIRKKFPPCANDRVVEEESRLHTPCERKHPPSSCPPVGTPTPHINTSKSRPITSHVSSSVMVHKIR